MLRFESIGAAGSGGWGTSFDLAGNETIENTTGMSRTCFCGSASSSRPTTARVTEVVYCSDRYHATESMTASRRMLSLANVKTRRFSSTNRINAIDFNNVDPA